MRQFALSVLAIGTVLSTNVSAENIVVNEAAKAGVKKCLPAIKNIADFLIENGDAGAYSTWNKDTPDMQVFSSTIERNYSDKSVLTSLTVAPVASGECAAVYDQIIYWPKSCIALSKETYGDFKYKDYVNKNVTLLQSGITHVYLIPTESGGCVSVKKEILMDAMPSK